MKSILASAAFVGLLLGATANAAITTIPNGAGGTIACTVQSAPNAGERHCAGIFTSFDGAPIDINVGFPPAPVSGPDGHFPIVGVFHGWGGSKIATTSGDMQQWLNDGYAVFSMSDRGWGSSCGATDPKRLQPPTCDNGYNHLMDSRYEVRDAQEVFEGLADQAATGATAGEGLIDPQAIASMGSSYGGGISMALGALRNRKMMGAHEGSPNLDGYLVPWVSTGGKAMQIAAVQPDIPWTDLGYSLQPNGHTLDYVADAPYTQRGRIGVMKQSFVAGLYALGSAGSNYAPPNTDPDADLTAWFADINSGEPYDQNPLSEDIVDEVTRHHSSYYIDDSTAPAPMLISNGWTDDLFPPDEAIRFYHRTRATHPSTPIAIMFGDHGHQRGQNKVPDATFRSRQRKAWFDFYVKGTGSQPFLGVQTLTSVCGGPSGGATGSFDDPNTDLPFQAATWAALAPGEVRLAGAAQQVISPAVPSDGPVGQAFDPISGSGACATASADDQVGAASYRLDPAPAGGFTLMGSATVVACIFSPSPTAQLAARLLDVDPGSGEETLVGRGLYRPEVSGTDPTRQVFQLHPNGWLFAAGHIAKLELLPADQPYGRNSNGQAAIVVSELELRLPVLEAPDAGLIQSPAPRVLPTGYSLAPGFSAGVALSTLPTCAPILPLPTTTTSTTLPPTTTSTIAGATTSTSSTTSTTLSPTQNFNVSRVVIRAQQSPGSATGSIRVQGNFPMPPAFSVPPSFSVRVQDGGSLDRLHTFNDCTTSSTGRIRCREETPDGLFRASFRPFHGAPYQGSAFRFNVTFLRQTISGPFAAPVTVTLLHNSAVVRSDTETYCSQAGTGLRCR